MSRYLYTAKHATTGESKSGESVAADERSLAAELRSQGFLLTSAKEIREETGVRAKFLDRFKTVPLKEKMVFARNLAVMISSGLVVSRAIKSLSLQTRNKTFRQLLSAVYEDIQAGKSLSEGLAKYPSVFSELFTSMVYVGEVSGNLEMVLGILALQLEKEHDLKSKVRGALMYPSVVLVAMIGIGFVMLTYILPSITGVFKDLGAELPPMTVFVMNMSDFLREHMILSLLIIVGAVVGSFLFGATDPGKRFFHFLTVRMPIFGPIAVKVNCARFSRIYSSLLRSGVSVVDGLAIVSKTLSNVYYKAALSEAIESVQKGKELSSVVAAHEELFPLLVSQILEVGEETGKTEVVLERLAEFYEGEVSQITANLSSIIEPLLMLVIGGAVGFFAVAMLTPMYSVLQNIQ
ncbi:MAG: type II secretion system F family protein [Candidatus Moranbacteria bacterium]|nr:type II secretion system F family protein [Candidatus Moranbacteria bacterium]NTW46317.1 type II secretion system F family protein [Candidatus Moranbacteria bacterium]